MIAGTLGFNPVLKGANDGTVALEETFLPFPHQHQELKRGHKAIVFSKKTHVLIKEFFEKEDHSVISE